MDQNNHLSTDHIPHPGRIRSTYSSENGAPTMVDTSQDDDMMHDYEQQIQVPASTGTTRSFRDASGRIRFLCSNPECHRRVPRRSETFCKRHQTEVQGRIIENQRRPVTTFDPYTEKKECHSIDDIDMNHNQKERRSQIRGSQSVEIKRPVANSVSNIVISTTTLLDNQWADVLEFLRQFRHVQLATNLNVNNLTTHLLIDDSENRLRCTITKKIVQASVRRHVFIISARWVTECLRQKTIVDERSFEIAGDSHTLLRPSRQDCQINEQYLFNEIALKATYGFAIECRQCQGSITRPELIELIQLSGAKLFDNDQNMDVLIVLCDAADRSLDKIKEKYLNHNIPTIKFVASDFLLKSIIKFEIQEIDKYFL